MSAQGVVSIPREQMGSFVLYVYEREDGVSKVLLEIVDDLVPAVGETVRARVVEVVREVVER